MNPFAIFWFLVPLFFAQSGKTVSGGLSDSEVKELGALTLKYFKAKDQSKDEGKTFEKLNDEVEQIQKKKPGILKHVKDWERVLDLSEDFARDALVAGSEGVRDFATDDGAKVRYYFSVPKGYDKKTATPLLLIIPENSKDNPKDQFSKHWNVPEIKNTFIVCIPQMPDDTKIWTEPEGYGNALSLFGRVLRQAHVDCNRVFIAGVGEGSKSAATVASQFPSRWAGAIFRGEETGFVFGENLLNLPVYASRESEEIKSLATRMGEIGGKLTQGEDDPAKIAAWASDKVRDTYPQTVILRPPNPRARSAYWVRLEQWETTEGLAPQDQKAVLKAVLNREENQITVTAEGVRSFILSFNDSMLDLDKPVHVVTNGKEWIGTIPRSLQFCLDRAYASNDNRLFYVRTQYFDAPPAPPAEGSSK